MKNLALFITTALVATSIVPAALATSFKAESKIQLEGKAAKFDFMTTDRANHRVLAAHKGAGTLEVLDSNTGKLLASIPAGEAQGVAVDEKGGRYFTGNDGDHSVAIVDTKSLRKTGEVKVEAPVDAITFDSKNGRVYAAADDGDHLWVIDPTAKQVVAQIKIPGIPEGLEYSAANNRIYLNIKDKNQVVEIDPDKNVVENTISSMPAQSPHGIAVDPKRGLVFVAGGNGKLVAVDFKSGKVSAQADIANGNDQLVFNSKDNLLIAACRGELSAVLVSDKGLSPGMSSPSPKGAHTIALDPNDSGVWVVFADSTHSYFQKFLIQ